jgi:iron only hydrogenase large subunit-like protein
VLNFREVDALLEAFSIDVEAEPEVPFPVVPAKEAREFPLTRAVSRSVCAAWRGGEDAIRPVILDGLTAENIAELGRLAREKTCEKGNLVEVMACPGGCVGGGMNLCAVKKSQPRVESHAAGCVSLADFD